MLEIVKDKGCARLVSIQEGGVPLHWDFWLSVYRYRRWGAYSLKMPALGKETWVWPCIGLVPKWPAEATTSIAECAEALTCAQR